MSKQPPPAPTASAVGPCPTVIQIAGRPGTESLPRTIAPPDHPRGKKDNTKRHHHRHHQRQPGEHQFPKQVVTG